MQFAALDHTLATQLCAQAGFSECIRLRTWRYSGSSPRSSDCPFARFLVLCKMSVASCVTVPSIVADSSDCFMRCISICHVGSSASRNVRSRSELRSMRWLQTLLMNTSSACRRVSTNSEVLRSFDIWFFSGHGGTTVPGNSVRSLRKSMWNSE
jgi:hypothetical protein